MAIVNFPESADYMKNACTTNKLQRGELSPVVVSWMHGAGYRAPRDTGYRV